MRRAAILAGIVALALMATAFFHLCLHSIDHNDVVNSRHHCLLCAIFSHTVFNFNASVFLLLPPLITNRPLLLMPVSSGEPPVQASITVRAPPGLGWN
jgi:hypothetical protein